MRGIEGTRRSNGLCDESSVAIYEDRFGGGGNGADGVLGDMALGASSVISSPDSDPGPGEVTLGIGGGTGRALLWSDSNMD